MDTRTPSDWSSEYGEADARETTDDTADGGVGVLVPDRNGAWAEQVSIAGFPIL